MDKTKIEWCDSTWNPITGCYHGCPYCYARKIANQFAGGVAHHEEKRSDGLHDLFQPVMVLRGGKRMAAPFPFAFEPTLYRYRLDDYIRKERPRNIFVCSTADLFGDWIPDEWIEEVFEACEAAPQHRYLFLTKNPKRLCNMATAHSIRKWNAKHPDKPAKETEEFQNITPLPVHDNWWFGSTLDNAQALRFQGGYTWHSFTSIEPIMEFMNMGLGSFGDDEWTIIGAETGTRKGKIVPKREWVENILDAASITGVKVFMKESLRELMGDDFRQQFPWEV
jgi:protein gp37